MDTDPFMTLVDVASHAAQIDDKKKGAPTEKETLSILAPKNKGLQVTHDDGSASRTTPPPRATSEIRGAVLISPSTPKTNNRTAIPGYRAPKQSFARELMDVLMNPAYNDIITFLPGTSLQP